jgi:hypothetical protein
MGEREIFQKKGREQRGRGRFEGREEAVQGWLIYKYMRNRKWECFFFFFLNNNNNEG